MSDFAQCIGCAAQPHRAAALAITVRNDFIVVGWEEFLALSWQRPPSTSLSASTRTFGC
jgi:hypothetical protein